MEFADGGACVAGAGEGVAPLVVWDAPGGLDVQTVAVVRRELPALDRRIGRHAHLADGPLWIFPPQLLTKSWPGTSN
jgi:hypothetical protein